MGLTYIQGKVKGKNDKAATVEFLVDSGANYTLLPKDVWEMLELKSKRTQTFILADGTKIDRGISECHIEILENEGHTPVILGDTGDDALLGVVTLEEFGLVLNPFNRTLQPMRMLLA
jgi:clan AA aspartic protease